MALNLFPIHARCAHCGIVYNVESDPDGLFFCSTFSACIEAKAAYLSALPTPEPESAPIDTPDSPAAVEYMPPIEYKPQITARCESCGIVYNVDTAPDGVYFCDAFAKCIEAKAAYEAAEAPTEETPVEAPIEEQGAPVDPAPAVAESSAPPDDPILELPEVPDVPSTVAP